MMMAFALASAMLAAQPAFAGCGCNAAAGAAVLSTEDVVLSSASGGSQPNNTVVIGAPTLIDAGAGALSGNTTADEPDSQDNLNDDLLISPGPSSEGGGVAGEGQTLRERARQAAQSIASHIIGTRTVSGVVEKVGAVVEKFMNKTVYAINGTRVVNIVRGMTVNVKPVSIQTEMIKVNGTTLLIRNITNPAVNIMVTMFRANGTVVKNMTITKLRDMNRLNLTVGNATSLTDDEVVYQNGTVYIARLNKTIPLKTLPDEIKELIEEKFKEKAEIREMLISAVQEKLKYMVKTRVKKHVLGFIPVDVNEETSVDADTGQIESTRGPWWGFLAW